MFRYGIPSFDGSVVIFRSWTSVFGCWGAVWVVNGNCTVFIDTGQNDKVTRVGKITRIHGTGGCRTAGRQGCFLVLPGCFLL